MRDTVGGWVWVGRITLDMCCGVCVKSVTDYKDDMLTDHNTDHDAHVDDYSDK